MGKLVRNKVPQIFPDDQYRKLDGETEYLLALVNKIDEELREVLDATMPYRKHQVTEELGDLYTAFAALVAFFNIDMFELVYEAGKKNERLGDFSERIYWVNHDEHPA